MSGRGVGTGIGTGLGAVGGFFVGGPAGALAGAGLGGAIGGEIGDSLDGDPEQEKLQHVLEQTQADTERYRQESAAQREHILGQQIGLYGPVNDLLTRMYGPGFSLDLAALQKPPPSYASAASLYRDPTLPYDDKATGPNHTGVTSGGALAVGGIPRQV